MDKNSALILLLFIGLNVVLAFYQPFSKSLFVDEGQYLLISKKMLDGLVPYRDVIESKPFGLYLSLIPAVLLCGKDIFKLRLYAALIVSLTSFFIFLIGNKLGGKWAGLFSAGVFMCIEATPAFYGYTLITEPIANLFIAALFYVLLLRKPNYANLFLVGAFTAAACSVRQTVVFVFIPLAFYMWHYSRKLETKKAIASLVAGAALITLPMLLYLILNSALWDAFYWCVIIFIRLGGTDLSYKVWAFVNFFAVPFSQFAILAFLSIRKLSRELEIVWLWLLSSFIFTQVAYTWSHYYLLLGPPLSILAGVGMMSLFKLKYKKNLKSSIVRGIVIFLILYTLLIVLVELVEIVETGRSDNDSESGVRVSEFLSSQTNKSDEVFVFMDYSGIYYLSDKDPISRMTFFFRGYFEIMNDTEMNELIFRPLEQHKPKYFVVDSYYLNDYIGVDRVDNGNALSVKQYLDEKYELYADIGSFQVYTRRLT